MKFAKAILLVIVALCATIGSTGVASAATGNGATVNFGSCMHNTPVEYRAAAAPGKSGNGPLTIVATPKGVVYGTPGGFDGWVGCNIG